MHIILTAVTPQTLEQNLVWCQRHTHPTQPVPCGAISNNVIGTTAQVRVAHSPMSQPRRASDTRLVVRPSSLCAAEFIHLLLGIIASRSTLINRKHMRARIRRACNLIQGARAHTRIHVIQHIFALPPGATQNSEP